MDDLVGRIRALIEASKASEYTQQTPYPDGHVATVTVHQPQRLHDDERAVLSKAAGALEHVRLFAAVCAKRERVGSVTRRDFESIIYLAKGGGLTDALREEPTDGQ